MTLPDEVEAKTGNTPKLNTALSAFQGEIKSFTPEEQRTVNVETRGDKPNYSYSYATLATILDKAGPIMAKHGLSFSSMPTYADPGDGKIVLVLAYTLAHSSGEERRGMCPLKHEGSIQSLGGVITFIRRYCQAAALGLASEADNDAMAEMIDGDQPGSVRAPSRSRQAPARPNQSARRQATLAAADALPGGNPAAGGQPPVPLAMKNHMFGLIGKLGFAKEDRASRLAFVSDSIGRSVASSNDLTREEIQLVIDKAQEQVDLMGEPTGLDEEESNADQG